MAAVDVRLAWQASLFDDGEPGVDETFGGLVRHELDARAWVDHVPGWVSGADRLFDELVATAPWAAHRRTMYDKVVDEPRLRAPGFRTALLDRILTVLTGRYGRPFDAVGLNLYRDGRDSVAWHGDRIPAEIVDPIVALVSLGHPRTLRLRPKVRGVSPARAFTMRRGDLLVMGGSSQRTWEHAIPKVASAGPRISIAFRHST